MLIAVVLLCACTPTSERPEPRVEDTAVAAAPGPELPPPTFLPDVPSRLAALGDVHGDLRAARRALQLAGAIDGDDQWIGGDLVVIQTGDQLDRGDKERKILDLFEALAVEAHAAGGGFYSLLGNHEIMNVELDFRYVTDGGADDFDDFSWEGDDNPPSDLPAEQLGRAEAFRPGGHYAQLLANHNVVMVVGDTAFVHGGIHAAHVEYGLEQINRHTQKWMLGKRDYPEVLSGDLSPVWSRAYSDDDEPTDCEGLDEALAAIPASRMVVGHTVQDVINPACDGKVWRIDVGMAEYYGGVPMALEIVGETIAVLE